MATIEDLKQAMITLATHSPSTMVEATKNIRRFEAGSPVAQKIALSLIRK